MFEVLNCHFSKTKIAIFQFLIFVSLSSWGQSKKALESSIDKVIEKYATKNDIPGAVILIKKNKKTLFHKAYGYANLLDQNGNNLKYLEPTSVNHLYDIASLTKVVGTTTAIMKLHDQKKLHVDDPIFKYLPDYHQNEKKTITIRHLLTHTSGMIEWYPMYYFSDNQKKTFELIKNLPLKYKVGEGRHYSDLGFTVLGEIIMKVSGQKLDDFFRKEIFEALGMNNTFFNPDQQKYSNAGTSVGNPYEKRMVYDSTLGFSVPGLNPETWNGWRNYLLKGQVNDGNAWYAGGGVSGAAGLFSHAADIEKLLSIILNKGKIGKKEFVSAETISLFLTKDKFNNGLGWMMDPSNSFMKNAPEGSFGHTGFTGTSIAVVPDKKLSIIILINRQNTGLNKEGTYFNVNPIRAEIFETVLNALN